MFAYMCVYVLSLLRFFLLFFSPWKALKAFSVGFTHLFQNPDYFLLFSPFLPGGKAGDVWCLPPVWNLRAVIWFHFAISSLVFLPSSVTLSVLSFSACCYIVLNFFQKILQHFSLRDRPFLYGSCLAARRSKLVGGMCRLLPYGIGICCYIFIYQWNGPWYQHVLALHAFFF